MKKTVRALIQSIEISAFKFFHFKQKHYHGKLFPVLRWKLYFSVIVMHFISGGIYGQAMLELSSAGVNTTAVGITTASQTGTFRLNTTGTTFNSFTPTTQATFSLSNQQFTHLYIPGLMFGAESNGSGEVQAANIWEIMDNSNALNSHFTSNITNTSGTGISVTSNYGIVMFNSLRYPYLLYGNSNYTARPYYGNLTITFNRPVSNPVVHFIGIGGHQFSLSNKYQHGYYLEYELSDADVSNGLTVTELSGSTYFDATTSNTKVVNSNTANPTIPTTGWYSLTSGTNAHGSSGSVKVNTGNNAITSVTFKVFLRGMDLVTDLTQGANVDINRKHWAPVRDTGGHTADKVLISLSLATYTITGTVYNDADGMTNNIIDGTATRYAGGTTQLYVNLVDNNNNVYASTAVSSTGTYTFANVVAAAGYKLVLSTSNAVTTASLPAAWAYTGEKEGSGTGSDGTPNGILPLGVLTADVTTRFGIRNCSSPPAVTAAAGTALYCAQSATSPIQLTATPTGGQTPYTYAWTGSGISNATIQNPTATPAAAGSYTVAITDALGCKASASTGNITYDNTVPSISWSCGTNPAWLRLNETNGTTWYWTTASGGKFYPNNTYNPAQDATTSALQQPYIKVAGPYTVKITSVNGCTSSGTINMSATPAGCATVLADEHIRLTAAWAGNNNVLVKWNTPLTNISNFTIQRSTNGTNFTDIGTTEYTQPSAYSFTDARIPAGCSKLWYRVKATDYNGRENFSSAASLNCNGISAGNIFIAPNPVVNKQFTLNYKVPVTGKLNYELLSVDGKRILAGILENPAPGETASKTIVLPPLEKGLYFLRVSNQQWISKTVKLMIGE